MSADRRILVINPNSNEAVTRGLDDALAPLARPGLGIACRTRAEGPFGTLEAQGFAVVDQGAVIQFTGPARLVMNGHGQ